MLLIFGTKLLNHHMPNEAIETKLGELIIQRKYSNILLVALMLVITITNIDNNNIDSVIVGMFFVGLFALAAIYHVTPDSKNIPKGRSKDNYLL